MNTFPELIILLVLAIAVIIYRNSKDKNPYKNNNKALQKRLCRLLKLL